MRDSSWLSRDFAHENIRGNDIERFQSCNPSPVEAMLYVRLSQQKCFLLLLLVVFFMLFVLFKRPFLFRIFGTSEKCLVYSPAYPSAGRAGCSSRCIEKRGKKTSTYVAAFYKENHHWPRELAENMELAASILKKFGQPRSLNTERGRHLHLSFDYYCCYTEEEGIKIGQFLNSYSWKPHEVWFDKMECAIHGHGDLVSLVLMVDKKSQQDLTQWALQNERDLEVTTGVHKNIPHTRLQDFHMTLGTLNQSNFPVQSAVEAINRVIPPGQWHKSPVFLQRPVCYGCEKVMKAHSEG